MTNGRLVEIIKMVISGVIALVLLIAMTWIVLSPDVTDEISKAALVVIGTAVGFIFGRETAR